LALLRGASRRPRYLGEHPLNALKAANDWWGHDSGDALLRRAGEVFNEIIARRHCAAPIGGDEFAAPMPATELRDGEAPVQRPEAGRPYGAGRIYA
jgi:diguanylate cyclase (GGDEF)-like protein